MAFSVPVGEVTEETAEAYISAHGYNEVTEKKKSLARKIVQRVISPISLMLLLASVLSYANGKLFDAGFILILLVANVGITLWQEGKADTAIEELNARLESTVKVFRGKVWTRIPSRSLVPQDIIELSSGDVIPADAVVTEAASVSVNEAALTGESLPKDKKNGDTLYSGSFIASGIVRARITATGSRTYFGKAIAQVDTEGKRSSLERDILRISQFLSLLSLVAVSVLTWVLVKGGAPWHEILRLDLSLVIAGIPISLPTVMTLIIAFGVIALARKNVIVRRLSSLEELANTEYVLTDKTGTLTLNRITVDEIISYETGSSDDVLRLAAEVASGDPDSAIEKAILERAGQSAAVLLSYIPADSARKRSTAVLERDSGFETLSLGAPQVIAGLCALTSEARSQFDADVERLATRGYRTLALSRVSGKEEKNMTLVGLMTLSDTLRDDAKDVVEFLAENGVGISMVTGDNHAIAAEIAETLSLPGTEIVTPAMKPAGGWQALTKEDFERTRSFAEILPDDKYEIVKSAKQYYVVAANGDGVNDLPAVREASVGFAVKNAVAALKGAADIVLLSEGISVMKDAFIEGRKIFMRLYAYSLYRISESFRLIATIAILGFWAGTYPLSPLQLILIAILNDVPIISLAANRVKVARRPSKIHVSQQFTISLLFGLTGIVNSILLYYVAFYILHFPLAVVQTMFFLKLTVSGHLLIYVAHTKERWWRYLPSAPVIWATSATQLAATALALSGFLMPAPISWTLVVFVWIWSFVFMQVAELMKLFRDRFSDPATRVI